jgi:hypothetical protein
MFNGRSGGDKASTHRHSREKFTVSTQGEDDLGKDLDEPLTDDPDNDDDDDANGDDDDEDDDENVADPD